MSNLQVIDFSARVPAICEDRALRTICKADTDAAAGPFVVKLAGQPALIKFLVANAAGAIRRQLAVAIGPALVKDGELSGISEGDYGARAAAIAGAFAASPLHLLFPEAIALQFGVTHAHAEIAAAGIGE